MKQDLLHVDLTPELIKEAQRRVDFIAKEGCTKNGVLEEIDTSVKPPWYDEKRFFRAQSLVREHYAAAINGAIVGLLIFLQLPVGLVPLLATERSKNPKELFKRYFNTVQYVDEWYHSDPFDPKSKSFKTMAMVRKMHINVNKTMNKKAKVFDFAKNVLKEKNPDIKDEEIEQYIRNKDRVWVSQYDMSLIQFSFLGCAVLEPKACGVHEGDKQFMEDVLYTWKVISYKLGIDPKYSLIEDLNYDMIYAMFKIILEQEYLLHMENNAAPEGIRMSEAILCVFKDIFIGTNCNVYLRYWYKKLNANSYKLNRETYEHNKLELFKVQTKNQLTDDERKEMLKNNYNDKYIVSNPSVPFEDFKLNGWSEKILYQLYLIVIDIVLKYKIGRQFVRFVIRKAIFRTRENKKEVLNRCEKMLDDRFQFSECPFVGKVDTKEYADIYQKDES